MAGYKTVLVIEDNELNKDLLVAILNHSYEVLTASNGQEGLDIMHKRGDDISLIFLDIQMPIMNGYQFMEEIHREKTHADVPILVATIDHSDQEQLRCLKLGAAGFVGKPYNPAIVLNYAQSLISIREQALSRVGESLPQAPAAQPDHSGNDLNAVFIQAMYHEMRTPLNAIVGFSELIANAEAMGQTRESVQGYVAAVEKGTKGLIEMVDELVECSRLITGNYEVSLVDVDLITALHEIVLITNRKKPEAMTVEVVAPSDETWEVRCDYRLLQQVFLAIMSNAYKFAAKGTVTIQAEKTDTEYLVSITDQGPGIPAEWVERVFEQFEKKDNYVPGIGLGLYIARRLLSEMRSRIWVDTTYSKGCRMMIAFPKID